MVRLQFPGLAQKCITGSSPVTCFMDTFATVCLIRRVLTAAAWSRRGLLDALDHMWDYTSDGRKLLPRNFEFDYKPRFKVDDIGYYDDLGSWPEWREGELKGLSPEDLEDALVGFRGPAWAKRAMRWIEVGTVPTIIIVVLPEATGVGDGRGRVSVALGLGWDTIPVVIATEK